MKGRIKVEAELREAQVDNINYREFAEMLLCFKPGQCLPDELYRNLPEEILQHLEICKTQRQKDMMLLGMLPVIGALMHNVEFQYQEKTYYPNLYTLIVAPPAHGKRFAMYAEHLSAKIDEANHMDYINELESPEKDKFVKPPIIYRIPGDSSNAALKEQLVANKGVGYILESEADTFANAEKQDWGGQSDMIRQSFEHETIARRRKGDKVPLVIKKPKFSFCVTGTPNQVSGIIRSVHDGTFSRFIIYSINEIGSFQAWEEDSQEGGKMDYEKGLASFGKQIHDLLASKSVKVKYDSGCREFVTKVGITLHREFSQQSMDLEPSVFRGVVQALKICSILTVLRNKQCISTEAENIELLADIEDLKLAFLIVGVGLANARKMVCKYNNAPDVKSSLRMFFERLPDGEFSTKVAIEKGHELGIAKRTVSDNLDRLVEDNNLEKVKHGLYRKVKPS